MLDPIAKHPNARHYSRNNNITIINIKIFVRETDRNPQSGRPTATLSNILAKGNNQFK